MATTYKTPGVYVEEITKLPPSVAEVETAIPAFVGYTAKAKRFVEDDLKNVPFRIKSLLEFEQYFGAGPSYSDIHVQLDVNKVVDEAATTVDQGVYNLYESMRLFYDNGGGSCYICSVGKYGDDAGVISDTKIKNGLAEVAKFDEPTLLLFPDAVNIKSGATVEWDKIAGIQQAALKQCGDLGDRFAILDIAEEASKNLSEEIEQFRNKVGLNNLKYGAAYSPFVETIYEKTFSLRDINENLYDSGGIQMYIKSLFTDTDKTSSGEPIKTKLDEFKQVYDDNKNMQKRLAVFSGEVADNFNISRLDTTYQTFLNEYNGAGTDALRKTKLKAAMEFVFFGFTQLEGLVQDHADANPANTKVDTSNTLTNDPTKPIRTALLVNATLKGSIQGLLGSTLKVALQKLINLDFEAYRNGASSDISNTGTDKPEIAATLVTAPSWTPTAGSDTALISGANIQEKGVVLFTQLSAIFETLKSGLLSAISSSVSLEGAMQDALIPDIPLYKSASKVLNSKVNTLPPSAAIAGVYATVDRDRGVWKAPANVSLNSISKLKDFIDDASQAGMNVDPNAGKSVNALRAFYGKGILVWGSRTLAGNDNEWRYVPVRRFYNFVEESCKKSTSWVVFEPNDANTWLRVKAQIENFLNNLWRRGALAGAKPEHAYVVNCGLGITMTAQDILEGRLNVEIAMAAVRPAEFIILKFSHKLQQS